MHQLTCVPKAPIRSTSSIPMENEFGFLVLWSFSSDGHVLSGAGQKLTITSNSKRKRKSSHNDACDISHLTGYITSQSYRHNQHSKCITSFSEAVHHHPPPMPPTLLKWGRNGSNSSVINNRVGKKASCLTIEKRKNQVCLTDPNVNNNSESSSSPKRTNMHGPKLFAMDGIFTEEDSMAELCAFALTDIIQSVVNGSDGCLISFGTRDSMNEFLLKCRYNSYAISAY
ncbi:unnamed protein product [Trichobilharzia regenti]|nr:unnamed protein product [Trichobilharzia regenti]